MELWGKSLDYTLLAAVVLAAVHWFGPHIRQGVRLRSELASSFGGGLAVAYVFLHLLPEIELAHEWLGDSVHFVTLASFLLFFILEVRLVALHDRAMNQATVSPDPGSRHQAVPPVSGGDHTHALASSGHKASTQVFWWHIALSWLYTWMVVFALPEESGEDLVFAMAGAIAVGLHLIYKDYVLRSHHTRDYETRGRYLLAIAPLVGWIAHQVVNPPEVVFDIFIAILAGILMQGVFRDELPNRHDARALWLIAGAATFSVLTLVTK